MLSCWVYSQLLERYKPASPGAKGCCPCTEQPFLQAVSQAEEHARLLSDPQWRGKFIYKEDFFCFKEAFKESIWPTLKKSFMANVRHCGFISRECIRTDTIPVLQIILLHTLKWQPAFWMGAHPDSNLPPPAKLSTAHRGPAYCLRLHRRVSVWDSSIFSWWVVSNLLSGKGRALNRSRSALIFIGYMGPRPSWLQTAPKGRQVWKWTSIPDPYYLESEGVLSPGPHQSQRNKHQQIFINNNTQAVQGSSGIQSASSMPRSAPRDTLGPLSQLQLESPSFELSHVK